MLASENIVQEPAKIVSCPYCGKETPIDIPENYAPTYSRCKPCGKKFILERLKEGLQVYQIGEAPCCSDPECRDIEMGSSDEQ